MRIHQTPPMKPIYSKVRTDLTEYPINLKFDLKVNHKNYLPDQPVRQRGKIQKEIGKSYQKIVKPTKVIIVNQQESDFSESDCPVFGDCCEECGEQQLCPTYKPQYTRPRQGRRRRKRDPLPYYYDTQACECRCTNKRLSQLTSSSDDESIEYVTIQTVNPPQPQVIYQQQQYPPQHVTFEEPLLPIQNNYQQTKKKDKTNPSEIKQKLVKQAPINRPVYEERVRKRYETPKIVHPQQLTKPQSATIPKVPTKPLYRKPQERPPRKIPKKPVLPNRPQPSYTKTSNSKQNGKNKGRSSSSDCDVEMECLSDC